VGSHFVRLRRLQRHAKSFDADRLAGVIKEDLQDANARVVTGGDDSREEVELAVGPARGRGGGDAAHFVRVARFGFNDQGQRLHRERWHYVLPGDLICVEPSPRQAMTVWMTRAVSLVSRTCMESTPTSWAG